MRTITLKIAKSLFLFSIFLTLFSAQAQAPQKMSYQAVIRNTSNTLVANTQIAIKVSLLQGSAIGTAVFVERHTSTTNINGLASIEIGTGTIISGTFAAINWATGTYFVKTETDPTGGTNYTIIGTSQLASVPYALYAASSGNSNSTWNTTGNVGTNPATSFIGTTDNNDLVLKRNNINAGQISSSNTRLGTNSAPQGSGTNNTIIGSNAGNNSQNGIGNTAIGTNALVNSNALANTAIGTESLGSVTTGSFNIGLGFNSQVPDPAGSNQLSIGNVIYGSNMSNTANGKIGIGVTVPTEKLEVAGKTKTTNLQVTDGAASGKILTSDASGNGTWETPSPNLSFWSELGGNIYNNNIGNIGIGTFSPTSKLNVNGQVTIDQKNFGGFGGLLIKGGTPTANYPNIGFSTNNSDNQDVTIGLISGVITENSPNYETMDLTFQNKGIDGILSEKMRINSDGNVGIGTSTPNALLQFGNTIANRKIVLWENANNDHQFYGFGINGGTLRYQVPSSADHAFYSGISTSSSAELFRIKGNGSLALNGDLGQPGQFLKSNGAGQPASWGFINIGGSPGTPGQILVSNGPASTPTWMDTSAIIKGVQMPEVTYIIPTNFNNAIPGASFNFNAPVAGKLVIWADTQSNLVCLDLDGACNWVWHLKTIVDNIEVKKTYLQVQTLTLEPFYDQAVGPIVINLSAGFHNIRFDEQLVSIVLLPTIKISAYAQFIPN